MLYANANTLTKLKKLYVYGQQDAFLWLFYVHFIGIGLGFRAQPTITSSWNWLENDCLTPVVHISIMLLRPVKWGAKCTTEPTNKQSNDVCDAQVNIGNGRNLPKLLLIQSIIYEQTLWALLNIVKKEYWHIQNQMSQHFRFKKNVCIHISQ